MDSYYIKSDDEKKAMRVESKADRVVVQIVNFNGVGPTVSLTEAADVQRAIEALQKAAEAAWTLT